MSWPPDLYGELTRRTELEEFIGANPDERLQGAKQRYADSLVDYIADCVYVYEPRNANKGEPVIVPVVLFPRQIDYLNWMLDCYRNRVSAPCEKSRDSGATWMACAFASWLWLFHRGSVVGFGSRKEILVDRLGDIQSIFEKIRSIIRYLPRYLHPIGFNAKLHSNYMRLYNPEISSAVIGEAGDNIGRGGRTSVYFVDEAAYIERPELLEASLTATTDCRIDISSPRVGTLFHEFCATSAHKFIFDVHDVPWHTEEWAKGKKAELESKGLGHIYKREYLRDATAGLAGQVIQSDWVAAALGAADRMQLGLKPLGKKYAALDVADGGADTNALVMRHGPSVLYAAQQREMRADEAGHWAYGVAIDFGATEFRYDALGVGAGVAAVTKMRKGIKEVIAWTGSAAVLYPTQPWDGKDGSLTNENMFMNLKSQSWWHLRQRFIETYKASVGVEHDPEMVISLDPGLADLRQLKSELTQVLYRHSPNGKIVIEKAPPGHKSPNLADAVMMLFAPAHLGIEFIGVF